VNERAPFPETVTSPEHGRVLVVAPHPDDDLLGCGGTASLHALQGDPVHVVIAYDGLLGDPEGRYDRTELARMRREEAVAGGACVGLEHYEFWSYPEGHEPTADELRAGATRLAERMTELGTDTVYAPWIGEQHLDHHVLARVVRLACALSGFSGRAWGYEVWTPLSATLVVDVTRVYPMKVQGLLKHRTQLAYADIVHYGLGLNAHRSLYLPADGHFGEAFAPLGPASEADRAALGL
jgi:LmbE family N-acetylglucosaminyl deacetylase